MIVKEFFRKRDDDVSLYRTYSTEGLQIRQIGTDEIYDDAVDVDGAPFIYEETDEPIGSETDPTMATEADYQAVLREMGVNV